MKTCPQCGKEYGDDDRFCTVEGAALVSVGAAADTLIGTVLADRYLVEERLGEGGMGEVYLAEHVRIKRKVAVKLMRKWMVGDPVAVSRFHREAENASQISHPNVAQVYDFGETSDGMIYLAMEFVPGEPLSSILEREGRLHTVRTVELIRQTAEALVAAHAMGILHRDLKPDNIMVARTRAGTDVVKLVDFGIARVMSRGTQQFTSTGMIVGTPDYMSPEQLTGDTLDERSDIYALALIAYRVLTGDGAFKAGPSGDTIVSRMMGKPRPLAEVRPDVEWPAALQAAFDKALSADPAERFADAMELVAELDAAINEMPLTEEEQEYLVLLSQRLATPSRGGMVIDAATSVRSISGVRGALSPTPTSGQRPVTVATPPSESKAMPRPTLTQPSEEVLPPSETASEQAGDEPSSEQTLPNAPRFATPVAATPVTASTTAEVRHAQPALPHPALPTGEGPAVAAGGRNRIGMIAAAVVALAVVGFAMSKMFGGGGDEQPAPVATVSADSAVADSLAATTDSLKGESIPEATAVDSQRVQRARSGVLALVSGSGKGSAFLVDTSGLFVTTASLIPASQRVDVFVDGEHTARANVVSVDSANGLAVLLVSPRTCRRCQPLEVGESDTTLTATAKGDSLLAMRVDGRNSVRTQSLVVSRVSTSALATTTSAGTSALGAPVLNPRTGGVVGVVTRRRGSVSIAGAASLRTLLSGARAAASRLTPNDSIFLSWPSRPVPAEVLTAAESATYDLAEYRVTKDGFDVLAMTPQVFAWRMAKSAPPPEDNPFAIDAKGPGGPPDPLLEWKVWRDYRDERRAVVVLQVSPDRAAYPQRPDKTLDARKGDFYAMTITRDGTPLVALESQSIHAVGNLDAYRREKKQIPNAGVYVFHPADFANATAKYEILIVDADQKRRVSMALSPKMLEMIAKDLGPWQR